MKVVFVITRSDVMGGASVHLLDLAAGLQSRGYDITILVGGQGVFLQHARDRSLKCISLKHMIREIDLLVDVKAIFELHGVLKRLKPDLVHLHSSKAGIIGRLSAIGLTAPCIFTAHGWAFTEGVSPRRRFLYRVIERLIAPLAKRIITVSDYDRSLALAERVAPSSQLAVVHNGMPDVPAEIRAQRAATGDVVRFVMVARFEAPKDQAALLRAFASISPVRWHLELIGDGPQMQAAIDLAANLGFADNVTFSGACTDVSARLSTSDVFVLISHWEGLPLTILEAMRAGLPVIASDVGGVSEAVLEGNTGYLVKRDSTALLVERLELLLADAGIRRRMGEAGRHRYESEFTFSLMLDKTIAVYEEALS
ncbi:glycosyltransferase family 4 protein [Pseudomonas sp. GD03944]|uniref:glycosyltransferase family 4 protein n=1 Tax=Pseudomonas sp. GD03944 TaxID=2975409 RepID=UPI002447B880|nr:glycosyltransferase family 4 protein [Pseudomonas sp. GD03944]MDH1262594.1 glycosyltransferase family 4 protein [Pseudomonas sp. GD03944]